MFRKYYTTRDMSLFQTPRKIEEAKRQMTEFGQVYLDANNMDVICDSDRLDDIRRYETFETADQAQDRFAWLTNDYRTWSGHGYSTERGIAFDTREDMAREGRIPDDQYREVRFKERNF